MYGEPSPAARASGVTGMAALLKKVSRGPSSSLLIRVLCIMAHFVFLQRALYTGSIQAFKIDFLIKKYRKPTYSALVEYYAPKRSRGGRSPFCPLTLSR